MPPANPLTQGLKRKNKEQAQRSHWSGINQVQQLQTGDPGWREANLAIPQPWQARRAHTT